MIQKRLSEIFAASPETAAYFSLLTPGADPLVAGLAYDSRDLKAGDLFFALDGVHTDGHRFIEAAVKNGASAVVCGREPEKTIPGVAYLLAREPKKAMSSLSAAFFDRPSRRLKTIGVTGTDGKSSTVYFIYQLLESRGKSAGLLSTVSFVKDKELEKNPFRQSTPEATLIHGILAAMLDHGKEWAVVEATSHGLSERTARLHDVEFDAAVLTNVTHEHLEFHGTWEKYCDDKLNLFRSLDGTRTAKKGLPCFGLANADDKSYLLAVQAAKERLLAYSVLRQDTDFYATEVAPDIEGTSFVFHDGKSSGRVRIPFPGAFNVENVLAAAGTVARLLGVSAVELLPAVERLKAVKGRMTPVRAGQPFSVIVDYAHTPGAFTRLFPMIRQYTKGKVIPVFGSGGERDTEKRPIQGEIASRYSDILILANEDPRGEDPMKLLEGIAAGCPGRRRGEDLFLIPDRREAIRKAYSLAGPGDTVLLLGKGHEGSIILKEGPVPWDEPDVAKELLKEAGYGS